MDDPFVANLEERAPTAAPRSPHRFSSFDTQLFTLDLSSPAQAKRALEAHLAETERRLEEASKLGTALIEQQRELTDKLKEVEHQQDEGQVGPELRRKLMDLEREYNEIGRETARAFLAPKRMVGGFLDEGNPGTPSFDQKSPLSPALFTSQATNSPSKVSVPSRKQRNQPSSRVHDIEFATEISTSLLAQVRQLQALLAEREESLKTTNLEKSRLELEAEGYAQRIRALDESEQRYKDENWGLETQTHELMAAVKDATDRETRINSSLVSITAEKGAIERELEELKQVNAKLLEEQTVTQKANDAEIHLLRRNLTAGDSEKSALQQKLLDLTSQNQELAKALAVQLRQSQAQAARDLSPDLDDEIPDQETPENSPPPSPNKPTPRHNQLETETLRSSLGHAHRMIQNLRSTIHREKTEKIELKRMLQEARDDIETRRRESTGAAQSTNKRQKTKPDPFKKPPRPDLLGAGRRGRTTEIEEINEFHDTDWEDNLGDISPTNTIKVKRSRLPVGGEQSDNPSDVYQTATEAEDAFETANERETATESEAFQTGIESMADDSDTDELTETEDNNNDVPRTPRQRMPSGLSFAKARDRSSFQSTASTSADEDDDDDAFFPSPGSQMSRHRLRVKRSFPRRIRPSGEAPMASNSQPSSARDSPATSFMQEEDVAELPEGQSLFAELAELDGDDGDDFGPSQSSTPRLRAALDSRRPSEAMLDDLPPPRPVMVDSGVMTEPWVAPMMAPVTTFYADAEEREAGPVDSVPSTPKTAVTQEEEEEEEEEEEKEEQPQTPRVRSTPKLVSSGTQWTPLRSPQGANEDHFSSVPTPPKMLWDEHAPTEERELSTTTPEDNSEPPCLPQLDLSIITQETLPVPPTRPDLSISYLLGGATEPVEHQLPPPVLPELSVSSIHAQDTQPVVPQLPEPEPLRFPTLDLSSVLPQYTVPVIARLPEPEPVVFPQLALSSLFSQATAPVIARLPEPEPVVFPQISLSSLYSQATAPVIARLPEPEPVVIPQLALSSLFSQATAPVSIPPPLEPQPAPLPQLAFSSVYSQYTEPVAAEIIRLERDLPVPIPIPVEKEKELPELGVSSIQSQHTAPVEARLPEPIPSPPLTLSMIPAQFTEPVVHRLPEAPELSVSNIRSVETSPVLPASVPEPISPELSVSSIRSIETSPVEPVSMPEPILPELSVSSISSVETSPIQAIVVVPEVPEPIVPELSFSHIRSVETSPVQPVSAPLPVLAPAFIPASEQWAVRPRTAVQDKHTAAAAVPIIVAEDSDAENTTRDVKEEEEEEEDTDAGLPLGAISGNTTARHGRQPSSSGVKQHADQGAQTILSAQQIDQILMDRVSSPRPLSPPDSDQARDPNPSPFATPKAKPRAAAVPQFQSASVATVQQQLTPKRPSSAASQASSSYNHPPLPADHREIIMAAEKRSMEQYPQAQPPSFMGPPVAPASAYRTTNNGPPPRPLTPSEQAATASAAAAVPTIASQGASTRTTSSRAKMRRESQSQLSRKSSISSFASELDERFNPSLNLGPHTNGYGAGTDPRMIQAITQTMIGEFLWKYTRKVSGDISNTRHRRYFWVHPYTRTLYWSEQDPQTAGKTQLRTKSVPIEAVRVVADDNPYPPGLHCKSLEVVSPGRRVRFTATTSQRHETWFNALSYLLLRNSENDEEVAADNHIDEFNPGFRSSSRNTARMSFSSYNSRGTRTVPKQRAGSAMSSRAPVTPGRVSPALSAPQNSLQVPDSASSRQGSATRISSIFNSTIRGSFASLKGAAARQQGATATTMMMEEGDSAFDENDSVEDLRHTPGRHHDHDPDRLENVRACCDGRHDVGSLSRVSRYSPRVNRIQHHH
ncbi:hypothetical protein ASPZODRAFT_130204 [Penicilliopsis zonata CBS 506.65]|uniref:PH domain-containing protein n=1 Tax=Penicilliopsis zonata CBS 506.65 TaxID=1073090 RepID=A0A1L9SMB1_9EURO|nr:hypothetical protein ASPZODRAFT_130204 [Penicilliopsis zonata CBS 506.65]OJJ48246.1 hypothetical protein ASPZODRAFT_130204 [Penicilliopsis zonata CBS 506.65]